MWTKSSYCFRVNFRTRQIHSVYRHPLDNNVLTHALKNVEPITFYYIGFFINFISEPVISAFTSASAFVILYGQIKNLIGVKFGNSSDTVIDQTIGYFKSLKNIRWDTQHSHCFCILHDQWRRSNVRRTTNSFYSGWDTLLGIVCLCTLLLMRDMGLRKTPRFGIQEKVWSILREIVRNIKSGMFHVILQTNISQFWRSNSVLKLYVNIKSYNPTWYLYDVKLKNNSMPCGISCELIVKMSVLF